ncbi:hypothetical protein Dsin_013614 [Dipteronia sinensis]|uniref:Uncharacterized protein n=1 Tax=Dipteronia sinensis TaxID=43782 RepID=A0AAE0ALI0_9ROSI|nr:hypothetical protein Dsin_013614 [Dipteronia sinensis]
MAYLNLHAAWWYLNLEFFDQIEGADSDVLNGLLECIRKLVPNRELQNKIDDEITMYTEAQGLFGNYIVVRKRNIKSQAHTNKRNRLTQKRLNDLVFVKYNRALKRQYNLRDTIDPLTLCDIDDRVGEPSYLVRSKAPSSSTPRPRLSQSQVRSVGLADENESEEECEMEEGGDEFQGRIKWR